MPSRLDREVAPLRTGDAQVEMIIPDTHRVQTFGLNLISNWVRRRYREEYA